MNAILSVREIRETDIVSICDYWLKADNQFLINMGVDLKKLPDRQQFTKMLSEQIILPYQEKRSYCIIWEADSTAIGHCNTNPTVYGEEAYMHLHIWNDGLRKKGAGTELVKMTIPHFFENLRLKKLYSEPYALNPAPNKTLEKAGFIFIKKYTTIPGSLNFEQLVNLWELTYEKYKQDL